MHTNELRPAERHILNCYLNGEDFDACEEAAALIFDFLEGLGFLKRDGKDFVATGKLPSDDLRPYEKEIILQMIRDKMMVDRGGVPDGEAVICIIEKFPFKDFFVKKGCMSLQREEKIISGKEQY